MKTIRLLFLLFLLTALTACGGSEPPAPPEGPETVSLTVWGAEEDQELLQEILAVAFLLLTLPGLLPVLAIVALLIGVILGLLAVFLPLDLHFHRLLLSAKQALQVGGVFFQQAPGFAAFGCQRHPQNALGALENFHLHAAQIFRVQVNLHLGLPLGQRLVQRAGDLLVEIRFLALLRLLSLAHLNRRGLHIPKHRFCALGKVCAFQAVLLFASLLDRKKLSAEQLRRLWEIVGDGE